MSILVNLPDGSRASFPDGTTPDVMKAAIQKKFPPTGAPSTPAPDAARAPGFAPGKGEEVSTNLEDASGKPIFRTGRVENTAAGLNDAIYSTLGYPSDAARNVINDVVIGVNKLTGQPLDKNTLPTDSNILGRKWIANAFKNTVGTPDPDQVIPQDELDKILRAAGGGAGLAVAPEAIVGVLPRLGYTGERAAAVMSQLFGRADRAASTAANAFGGAVAGAGSQGAMDAAPEPLKPLAAMLGGIGSGAVAAGVTALPTLGRNGVTLGKRMLEPFSARGQKAGVGRQLRDGATDPDQVIRSIGERPVTPLPGADPTTFQQTGDMGIGAMERAAQTKDPAVFNQRRADQNGARVGALQGMQATGSPDAVAAQVRRRLTQIDADTNAALDQARNSARGADARLGSALRPEDAGDTLRTGLETKRAAAIEKERALWQAVDPDGTLVLSPNSTRSTVARIQQETPKLAAPFGREEAAIYQSLDGIENNQALPFREVSALRSRVSQAIADERGIHGKSPAWARLVQLRSAIEDDLENAVVNKVQLEQQAVARGEMSLEATAEHRIKQWQDAFFAARSARAAGYDGGSDAGADAGRRPFAFPRVSGAKGPRDERPGNPAGDQRLPENARRTAESLTIDDLRAKPAGDPYFYHSRDGQVFVPLKPGQPDLGSALVPEGGEAPIRIRRGELKHIGNVVHRADAEILGYRDPWDMVTDVAAHWDRMHRGYDGRLLLTKLNNGTHGVAVVELAPVDDGHYYRIVTVGRRHQDQLGEQIGARVHSPEAASGSTAPAVTGASQNSGEDAGLARAPILHQYTPRPMPEQEMRPFDPAAKRRLDVATAATRNRGSTFDNRQLGPILARPADHAPYNMDSARVASRVFMPGPGGFERLQTYFRANGAPAARKAVEGYAIDRLRAEAMGPDGVLDAGKLASWRKKYADALRGLPELSNRVTTAEQAAVALSDVAAQRKIALDDAQRDILGKLIGVSDPHDITRVVGSIFGRGDAIRQMTQLRNAIGSNIDAQQGLRKAVADYLINRFIGNTEAATSGLGTIKSDQLQTFIAQNKGALRLAGFSDDELRTMDAIAESLQQSNRSISSVKLPGQSNTAQDVLAAKAGDTVGMSVIKGLALAASSGGGWLVGGPVGALAAPVVGHVVMTLRQNGVQKMDELMRDALLDPGLARLLMIKATPANAKYVGAHIGQRLGRFAVAGTNAALATRNAP